MSMRPSRVQWLMLALGVCLFLFMDAELWRSVAAQV